MSAEHTCAIHDVVMNGFNDHISAIEVGQKELKELLIELHKENLSHIKTSSEKNRVALEKLNARLETEVNKFYDRDREYLIKVHDLQTKLSEKITQVKNKVLIITGAGISVATAVTVLAHILKFTGNL